MTRDCSSVSVGWVSEGCMTEISALGMVSLADSSPEELVPDPESLGPSSGTTGCVDLA